MAVSRRAILNGLLGAGAAMLGGTGAYGFLYARHQLEITRAAAAGGEAAPVAVRTSHRSHHRRAPQPLGLGRRRDSSGGDVDGRSAGRHRPRRRLRHVGRPRLRPRGGRSARPALGAVRRLRHSRQSRRRSRHAGRSRRARRADAEGRPHDRERSRAKRWTSSASGTGRSADRTSPQSSAAPPASRCCSRTIRAASRRRRP